VPQKTTQALTSLGYHAILEIAERNRIRSLNGSFHLPLFYWRSNVLGLFKNVQMQGAQKTEPRGVYEYTLSDAVCSATQ
jgi:hypothetical protein